jgi:hypothetical protein
MATKLGKLIAPDHIAGRFGMLSNFMHLKPEEPGLNAVRVAGSHGGS